MKNVSISRLAWALTLLASVLASNSTATGQAQLVITNDDLPPPIASGMSFYSVAPNGALTLQNFLVTFGNGISGGFFGPSRIKMLNNANQQCVFASHAWGGNIAGVNLRTMTQGALARGSPADDGSANGIGLALTDRYLYASYSDSSTIATFALQDGCGLMFLNDISVSGTEGGRINGMAAHGNMLVVTYTDGTIESFDISGGTPLTHGDKRLSSATRRTRGASYPNSVDITSDGRFAIFGDTSTSVVVEVSDISSGSLMPTVVYTSEASISASNVMLSPDETVLYVVNTQGAAVTVFFFDKTTGKLSSGCTSDRIRRESRKWSYLAGLTLANPTGDGGGVYVAEYGNLSAIALIKLKVTGRTCSLKEAFGSPYADPNSEGLLSIGSFPPRSF